MPRFLTCSKAGLGLERVKNIDNMHVKNHTRKVLYIDDYPRNAGEESPNVIY